MPGLVHAVSVATMGCHVYYDALRYALYHELCTHRAYYTRTGRIDEGFGARFRGRLLQDRDTAVMLGWVQTFKPSNVHETKDSDIVGCEDRSSFL